MVNERLSIWKITQFCQLYVWHIWYLKVLQDGSNKSATLGKFGCNCITIAVKIEPFGTKYPYCITDYSKRLEFPEKIGSYGNLIVTMQSTVKFLTLRAKLSNVSMNRRFWLLTKFDSTRQQLKINWHVDYIAQQTWQILSNKTNIFRTTD